LETPMNALSLLQQDHDKMRRLLNELETTTERGIKTREELYATIKGELLVHEAIEEEIFYPALKAQPKAEDIVLEAYEEHHVVDVVMAELEGLPVDDETWGAKAKVMKENVEHHMEEEEGEMFKQARAVFDRSELDELGGRMAARKAQAQHEFSVSAGRR
jgi:Hemerythrin HHE cation binding domain